jgi:hypothetical protein
VIRVNCTKFEITNMHVSKVQIIIYDEDKMYIFLYML